MGYGIVPYSYFKAMNIKVTVIIGKGKKVPELEFTYKRQDTGSGGTYIERTFRSYFLKIVYRCEARPF